MDCHKPDPHNGQFAKRPDGGECASCHNVKGWKPSTFTVKEHAATAYPLMGGHARLECAQCHIPKGKDTLYKIKFQLCTDCHSDRHAGQFASAPYLNQCYKCHTLDAYRPSTFSLARHKQTRFLLTGGHVAVAWSLAIWSFSLLTSMASTLAPNILAICAPYIPTPPTPITMAKSPACSSDFLTTWYGVD